MDELFNRSLLHGSLSLDSFLLFFFLNFRLIINNMKALMMSSVRVVNEKERERRAPKARESRRRGGRTRRRRRRGWARGGVWGGGVPSTPGRGWGRGCAPSQEIFFWFWLSIWWVFVHSGWYFFAVQLPVLHAKPEFNRDRHIKAVMVSRWNSARSWSLHSLRTLRLCWTKMCSFIV